MALQHQFGFDGLPDPGRHATSAVPLHERTQLFLVAGPGTDGAERLLERALADSGLALHAPRRVPGAELLPPAHWQRRLPPRTVIAFGAEAAGAVLSRPVSLNLERGRLRPLPDGGRLLVTEHPRAILRLADPVARGREYRRLVNDLLMAVPHRRLAA
jgi:hypothetical protein